MPLTTVGLLRARAAARGYYHRECCRRAEVELPAILGEMPSALCTFYLPRHPGLRHIVRRLRKLRGVV